LRVVGHYLWPQGETGLRCRVVVALALLIVAKVTNVYVPVLYKYAVDALGEPTAQAVAVPVALILAYGVARILAQAFGELRDAIFAPVSQRAIRNIALKVFHHLHALSLRFHLERQTGGLSRVIERGTNGMEFLIRFTTFNILPTLFEILLVGVVLWNLYDWRFSAVTLAAVGGYIVFSVILSEWRIKFVRRMNDADTEANAKAIDSLLNYETVKYFGNEEHEARRFDVGRRRYEQAAIRSSRTLSLLNVGQGALMRGQATEPVDSARAAERWITARGDQWAAGSGYSFAAVDGGGRVLGQVCVGPVDRRHGTGWVPYWTTAAARGRGTASRACRAAARWAFDVRLRYGCGEHRKAQEPAENRHQFTLNREPSPPVNVK
jgi:ABC-type multidrug transport system fused ATPase/permease subunit